MAGHGKLNIEMLIEKCEIYEKNEGRASFYDLSMEIVLDHPLQASIIMLATWNSQRFRFMTSDPRNLLNLTSAIPKVQSLFKEIDGTISDADFDEMSETIKKIYSILSSVKGVEYTGSSKVMHILKPELLVMWDTYIRDAYEFSNSAEDFLKFQKKMQTKISELIWNNPNKTLAKAIDEYNYVNISLPKIQEERARRKEKRARRKKR